VNLAQFLETYASAVTDAVLQTYPPLYNAELRRSCGFDLHRLIRRPLGAQADAIRATALSIQRQPGTVVVGEMGSGKSLIAAAAAYLAGCRRVFIMCPPHLVRKWRREIEQTVPSAHIAIVRTIGDLERARSPSASVQFVICSREYAKLGYRWRPAFVSRFMRGVDGVGVRDETGAFVRACCCPACFAPIVDGEGVPLIRADLAEKKHRCDGCGSPLWEADRTGPRRVPLADYVLRRMRGYFDLCVVDEVHELKARGSAQGLAGAALAEACPKTLVLTGTLLGGYASNLFHLLYRFSPAIRAEFAHDDEAKWVARYGYLERITKRDPNAYVDDGRQSKRRGYVTRIVEKPGITPPIVLHLIGNTVFLRLRDVAQHLPSYEERVVLVPMAEAVGPDVPSQASCYRHLAAELRQAVQQALRAGSKRLLGAYLQALLSYPDACTREETVLDPRTNEVLAHAPALPQDQLYPKERALIELVRRERERGRRVLVYVTHTNLRDLTPRLSGVFERAGFRVAVLKADTVTAERREEWVAARVRAGLDVLVTNPRLVQTGLDLVAFPSIVWAEVDYSVYTLRQASRRSWRIGQAAPVEVSFFVYEGTLQADALGLVAAKTRASLMVEGDLPEDGLAALEGDGGDVVLALARRLAETGHPEDQRHSLEALFANARQIENEADELLVENGWDSAAEQDRESMPVLALPPLATVVPLDDLPLLAAADDPGALPTPAPSEGRILTFDQLAHLLRRQKPRRKVVPEGQLVLFGS
jgi:superfamily II DNA or RNA helicase